MAKSKGNFYTLGGLVEKGHEPMAIRLALLSAHYRQPMNLTLDGIGEAGKNLERIRELVRRLEPDDTVADRPEIAEAAARAVREFDAALDDDLNASVARAAVLGLVTDVNRAGLPLSPADSARVREALEAFDAVLGLRLLFTAPAETLDDEVARLIEERIDARARRDFATADRIRTALAARGILLDDTPSGTTWKHA